MLARIDTTFSDTAAAQLSLGLGLPAQPALSGLTVPVPGGRVELRILGSSHQALLELDGSGCSEVVACSTGLPAGLPEQADRAFAGLGYRFRSATTRLDPAALAREAAALVEAYRDDAAALVGVFPGAPTAVTVLAATPGPAGVAWRSWHVSPQSSEIVAWRSWHVYPQSGEVVATSTEVHRR
jgi:hypothetical protein